MEIYCIVVNEQLLIYYYYDLLCAYVLRLNIILQRPNNFNIIRRPTEYIENYVILDTYKSHTYK